MPQKIAKHPGAPASVPTPEYRPALHPDVLFRIHSTDRRYSVVHLGGEEYWMHGTWIALSGNRIIVVRDRVFRVSELEDAVLAIEMPLAVNPCRPAIS